MKYAKWITKNDSQRGASAFRAELRAGREGRGKIWGVVLYRTDDRRSINRAHRLMKEAEAAVEAQGARIMGKMYQKDNIDEMADSEVARMGYFDSTAAVGLARLLPSVYLYSDGVKV